ncbi:MAG: outer membrane beta-barrel protein, partial [Deltaproteobacteria bacterium]|nr:outer membrane beta-barrel protein [Deltaproteobacteria bacterium]
ADFTFNPSFSCRGEYDDNINFDNDNEISDWLGIFIPRLETSWQDERFDLRGSAEAEIRRYLDEGQYDDEYQRYHLNGSYQATERLSLEAGAGYIRDSTLDSELEETGIVEDLYLRERWDVDGGLRFRLGERVFSSLNYGYGNTSYEGPGNVDYDTHSLVGSLSWLLKNQRDQVFLQPSYYHYESDVSQVDNYGLSLGWNRTLSEKLTLNCYLGLRYTDSEYYYKTYVPVFDPGSGSFYWQLASMTISESDFGGTADISLSGKTEVLSYKLAYNRDLSYTSTGSPIDRDRLTASLNWNMSPRLASGISAGLYFSKSNDDYSTEDSNYFYIHPHLSYRLFENHRLELHYQYARTRDNTLSDNDAYDRSRVWLALVFRFPKLLD